MIAHVLLVLATLVVPAGSGRAPRPWLSGLRWVHAKPLREADLAGRVVLVEFWAFDCINCRRTVPAMKRLEAEHRGESEFVIVGVHTPELEEERDFGNLTRAVGRLGLRYPVAHDPDYAAWRAFGNEYWPALYLLDRRGRVRLEHVGELHERTAAWDDLEHAIAALEQEKP